MAGCCGRPCTYWLGIAYEFDPYFGLSISRVDPLPRQLEAVYKHLLKLPSVRFLLADDAGAGKTIMASLLVRELKLRGLVERVLVVRPANHSFQWQRELVDKPSSGKEEHPRRRCRTSDHKRYEAGSRARGHAATSQRAAEADRRRAGPEFLRLANALSALYPRGSQEKRLLDAMLLAVPR